MIFNLPRNKKLFYNTIASVIFEIVTIICGFITPRLILSNFGSEINGLVSSISQFLGFITLADCGVGAVVQSALYKPLASKDTDEISRIYVSSERFFKKITVLLIVYTLGLMVFYPRVTNNSFNYLYTASLILVISVTSFAQFFMGITSRMLLNADQLGFIGVSIQTVSLILNTLGCYILIRMDASIHTVKIMTSIVFLLRPVALSIIVRRHYNINRRIKIEGEPIKQKWNGLAQHVSSVILQNTDVMVLSLFSSLQNVSIYSVYYIVLNGIKTLLVSATNGTQALIGNLLANKEKERLEHFFSKFEWLAHTLVTCVFCITGILVVPFVKVYTKGISDANYIVLEFAIVMSVAQAFYCLRLPYNTVVLAAGHFKETQLSAILEAIINVVISVLMVLKYGLVGVAIGTLVAMMYRTIYLSIYLSKHILNRNIIYFIKHLIVDCIIVGISAMIVISLSTLFTLDSIDYLSWTILAIKVSAVVIIVSLITNFVFYREYINKGLFNYRS